MRKKELLERIDILEGRLAILETVVASLIEECSPKYKKLKEELKGQKKRGRPLGSKNKKEKTNE